MITTDAEYYFLSLGVSETPYFIKFELGSHDGHAAGMVGGKFAWTHFPLGNLRDGLVPFDLEKHLHLFPRAAHALIVRELI
jgi:hypothetical protein